MAKGDVIIRGYIVTVEEKMYLENESGRLDEYNTKSIETFKQSFPQIDLPALARFLNSEKSKGNNE